VAFEREVNDGIPDPDIGNFNVLQKRR
jgi:hypothetical protein